MVDVVTPIVSYLDENSSKILLTVLSLVIGFIIIKLINRGLGKLFDKTDFDRTLEVFTQKTVYIFLWIVLILIILGNLGFDVTAFIAGLGVLGFIIGFAAKDSLGNIAAGFMILANKPFKVNDRIIAAGVTGVVKEMSIAKTIIITDANEYVMIPNTKIWSGVIKNLSRLPSKPKEEGKKE